MSLVFVNCTGETFTPTKSGAICTWIWELCQVAQGRGVQPLVISRSSSAEPYHWPKTIFIDYPTLPRNRIAGRLLRVQRQITGWCHIREKAYNVRVANAIRRAGVENAPLVLNNNIELAVYLRRCFPDAFILHNTQNNNTCSKKFRQQFAAAVNVATAVSDHCGAWNERYFGMEKLGIKTLYNGVDLDRFYPASMPSTSPTTVNFVGRTDSSKAPDLLLAAAKEVSRKTKRFRVQILGSSHYGHSVHDDYQQRIHDMAAELEAIGVPVHRPGFIDRHSLPDQLRKAHIHVVPSRWDEPFGLVTPEGMACGLATIASRTGGTPEIVGDAGFLFERDNIEQLASLLEPLIMSKSLQTEYGRKARIRAQDFTWHRTWDRLTSLIGN